jgi:hypothetical protein
MGMPGTIKTLKIEFDDGSRELIERAEDGEFSCEDYYPDGALRSAGGMSEQGLAVYLETLGARATANADRD